MLHTMGNIHVTCKLHATCYPSYPATCHKMLLIIQDDATPGVTSYSLYPRGFQSIATLLSGFDIKTSS